MSQEKELTRQDKESCTLEIIYITSPWCWPCKQQTPIIDELKEKYWDDAVTKKDISIEENMKWAVDENVQSTPTTIVRYHCPQPMSDKWFIDKSFVGFTMKDDIINYIENWK